MAEIYALRDPRDGAIRYIGKANNAVKRLASHLRDSRRRNTPVYCWIRKLAESGMVPRLEVLEQADDWAEAERRLIALSRARGDRLLNVADGGDEPFCPREVRAENGRKVAAMRQIDPMQRRIWEIKRALSCALRDGYLSNAARAKLRLAAAKRPDLFGLWAAIPDRAE
ncbi:hypothetical protein LMG18090_04388 [Ralstonia mannitolilytica]|uniref:GIY-YIG nuclease family protein n=1 Tax=Ralstonia mannitolilytica TaxID=105219 RepID=UPI0028F5E985|nr:GIY-YIG nuclease family protein [Ralstonia mannitolilytica]CAJ0803088.1 hypothetical protein LMG18090_04388 [Ralstonia mannitolilytica]